MTRRFLLTGAQGFIARYLVACLLDRFPQSTVLGIGRSPGQNLVFHHAVSKEGRDFPAPLPEDLREVDTGRYAYVCCEFSSTSFAGLIRDFNPTIVIHLAASLRGISEEAVSQNNVRSTENLLAAVRAARVHIALFMFASSGGVYGKQEDLPIAETAVARPLDLYSRSKLASEDVARGFALQSGTPTVIARIFNVLGPGQDEFHFAGRMAGQVAAILAGRSAPVIRTGVLSSTRDFLDVRDVCSALATVLKPSFDGICNIASGVETKVSDLLQHFLQAGGLKTSVEIQRETSRQDLIPRHFANIDRLTKAGFAPRYSLAHTCVDMLNYYARLIYTE